MKREALAERLRAVAILVLLAVACSSPPQEALQLQGNLLTVQNQTSRDWNNVEIWLNTYFRMTTTTIPAGGRFQVPLDAFVASYGQRFNFRRMQITDLRLNAKEPDGTAIEIKKEFQKGGLAGALPGKR